MRDGSATQRWARRIALASWNRCTGERTFLICQRLPALRMGLAGLRRCRERNNARRLQQRAGPPNASRNYLNAKFSTRGTRPVYATQGAMIFLWMACLLKRSTRSASRMRHQSNDQARCMPFHSCLRRKHRRRHWVMPASHRRADRHRLPGASATLHARRTSGGT